MMKKTLILPVLLFVSHSFCVMAQEPLPNPSGELQANKYRPATAQEIQGLKKKIIEDNNAVILDKEEIKSIRNKSIDAQGSIFYNGKEGQTRRPRPRSIVIDAAVVTNEEPPTINLSEGIVSPISFVDSKGKPWPIQQTIFDPRILSENGSGCGTEKVSHMAPMEGEDRPNTISLMPCRHETFGNIIVKLEGYPYPIVFMIESGDKISNIDMPVTIRIKGTTPFSDLKNNGNIYPQQISVSNTQRNRHLVSGVAATRPTTNSALHNLAKGITPKNAVKLYTSSQSVDAWVYDDHVYIRGNIAVINPQAIESADDTRGRTIWKLAYPLSRVLVLKDNGSEESITFDY